MNNLDFQYLKLLETILKEGQIKSDRTGTGTQSIFGYQIKHNMCDGFPLLTTKKVHFKGIVTELLWFLKGDTNIKYLVDNDCYIWVGDAYKNYLKNADHGGSCDECGEEYNNEPDWRFMTTCALCGTEKKVTPITREQFIEKIKTDLQFALKWGNLGPVYGKQWRNWHHVEFEEQYRQKDDTYHNFFDQIKMLVDDLKHNPDSRRLMVNAWNIADVKKMVLPPCHYGFQCYTTELTTAERVQILLGTSIYTQLDKEGRRIWYGTMPNYENEQDTINRLDKLRVPKRKLSLMWNQRSVDTPLGLPFNIASYGLLLMILARYVNMVPDQLIGNLGDTHIYLNQMDGVKEQLTREALDLPKVHVAFKGDRIEDISEYQIEDIVLHNYQSQPKINFPLSN